MNVERFTSERTGTIRNIPKSIYHCFEPKPLPFKVHYTPEIAKLLADASLNLGNLSEAGRRLKNPHLVIMPYLKKEAVLSSKIEGTKTTLSDVFLHEKDVKRPKDDDLREVINYVSALEHGLKRIKKEKISTNLIFEMHKILLDSVRGENKNPGEYKREINWIGSSFDISEAKFVPCGPENVQILMENLVDYINNDSEDGTLVKAAIMHYQFETIHPFRDGNGRLGRLLIILYLCQERLIDEPLFYLSAFFEKYREDYENKLQNIREKGEIENWLKFFLSGVKIQARDSLERVEKLDLYREECIKQLKKISQSNTVLEVLDLLFENPYISITDVSRRLKTYYPKAKYNVEILIDAEIIEEIKSDRREKIFVSKVIKDILEA